MTKVKPTTKEQLVYYLIQNISLGTYDRRFLVNLQATQVRDKSPTTSNQAALLDKITLRYAKQLRRQEIDANDMVKLPWNIEPIDSMPEFTDAFCEIKDGIIEVRSPYKKEFITDVKKTDFNLTWTKETKIWSAPCCEYTLRHFIDCLDKHYQVVRYCAETTKIIETFADYESATCWNPTYMKINGNYMIASINKSLAEALKDVPLDLDASTLARLTAAGVEISDEVKADACEEMWDTHYSHNLINFATKQPYTESIDELPTLVTMVKDIKCDFVLVIETLSTANARHIPILKEHLKLNNIEHRFIDRKTDSSTIDVRKYEFPIIINASLWGGVAKSGAFAVGKTVFLGNNKPIEIK
jgi:hypothetical protein